jgi:xylan 1,4-beta-xylosidase
VRLQFTRTLLCGLVGCGAVAGALFDAPNLVHAQQEVRTPPASAMPAEEIAQGLIAHDHALYVKTGWMRDPYITLGPDGMYYLTGTTPQEGEPREQSDPYNTGLGNGSIVGWQARVWRSRDLAQWESLGAPFTLQDGVWAAERPQRFRDVPQDQWHLWAPELHVVGERWALVHTSPAPVQAANLSFTAGPDLAGPWTNPMGAAIGRRHDPSLFRDDDGTWWMIWGATEIAPLKPDFTGFAAEPTSIGPSGATSKMGHEGCLLRKIEGKYVLFGTGWSTGEMRKGSYNLYYAIADRPTGPYGPRLFVGRFLGHGTPFQDAEGRWWCTAFFNANVPPIADADVASRDLGDNAFTINEQGVTIVPLDITRGADGRPLIRAKDPRYALPGPDELQQFEGAAGTE